MASQMEHLQADLRNAAAAFMAEARATALAVALEDDPDGYWIAVGPKAQLPFLVCGACSAEPEADEMQPLRANSRWFRSRHLFSTRGFGSSMH